MENKSKINSIMKMMIIIMLGLYLAIYVAPLGAYDGQYAGGYEEDDTFKEDRLWAATLTGVSCTLLMVSLYIIKKSEILKYVITSLVIGLIHIGLIFNEFLLFGYIPWYTPNYDGKFPAYLGAYLVSIIAIINVGFVVVAVIRLIDYIKNIKKYQLKNEFVRLYDDIPYVVVKQRDNVEGVTFRVTVVFSAILIVLSIVSLSIIGISGTILGYVIPVICFYIVFLKNWIYKGKWLKVISTYVVLMYTIYVLMFYMLPDVLLGVWVYIFNLNIDFLMVFRCLYLAISIILTVIIVWIGVIGIREKTYENQ